MLFPRAQDVQARFRAQDVQARFRAHVFERDFVHDMSKHDFDRMVKRDFEHEISMKGFSLSLSLSLSPAETKSAASPQPNHLDVAALLRDLAIVVAIDPSGPRGELLRPLGRGKNYNNSQL